MSDVVAERRALPALASVDDVALLFGPLDDADVARAGRLCEMASAAVRRFTRQTLSFVDGDVIIMPSSGTTVLQLGERPVSDVARVEVQLSPPQDEPEAVALAGWGATGVFTWYADGRVQRLDGLGWGRRYDPVLVEYSHGFEPVPADVVGLVAAKVANFLAGMSSNPDGLKSLQVGAMSETYANAGGSAQALGCSVLSEDEQAALLSMGFRRRTFSPDIGTQ